MSSSPACIHPGEFCHKKITIKYIVKPVARQSASAQHSGISGSTVKRYRAHRWPQLEAAWYAACDRGEHNHAASVAQPTVTRTPSSAPTTPQDTRTKSRMRQTTTAPSHPPTSRTVPNAPRCPPPSRIQTVFIDSRSPSPTGNSASPSDRSFHAAATPAGKLAYAVRCDGVGEIYDEYGPARDHYHGLQHLGRHPVLAVHKSLTAAVSFVEEGTGHRPRHLGQREHWIQEELLARAAVMPPSSPSSSEESDLTESLQEE